MFMSPEIKKVFKQEIPDLYENLYNLIDLEDDIIDSIVTELSESEEILSYKQICSIINGCISDFVDNIEEYNEETKYRYVQYISNVMQKTGRIKTEVYSEENLPKEGGYMMYPNHQGKYDVYGIFSVHKQPCSFVMDVKNQMLFL